jgi:hypothetical protein
MITNRACSPIGIIYSVILMGDGYDNSVTYTTKAVKQCFHSIGINRFYKISIG